MTVSKWDKAGTEHIQGRLGKKFTGGKRHSVCFRTEKAAREYLKGDAENPKSRRRARRAARRPARPTTNPEPEGGIAVPRISPNQIDSVPPGGSVAAGHKAGRVARGAGHSSPSAFARRRPTAPGGIFADQAVVRFRRDGQGRGFDAQGR